MNCYRIDYWNSNNTGSEVYFEKTEDAAMEHVASRTQTTAAAVEGTEHKTIQPFTGPSCDMSGWIEQTACGEVLVFEN